MKSLKSVELKTTNGGVNIVPDLTPTFALILAAKVMITIYG